MAGRGKLAVFAVVGACVFCGVYFSNAFAAPDRNGGVVESNDDLNQLVAQSAIPKKEQANLMLQVLTIAATRNRIALDRLRQYCSEEIQLHCSNNNATSVTLECIQSKRDLVSSLCESALRKEFGAKPLESDQLYLGISIPRGSIFRFNHQGDIAGVIAADNIQYNGIHFKKGSISFHVGVGISVGRLVADQYIDGIKYLASGLGPFFNRDGEVVNATLAKDTEIEGIVYMGGRQITFYSKGRVNSGTVAQEKNVQEESYFPGDRISFNHVGAIRRLAKINLYKPPQRGAGKESSDLLNRTFVTSTPLAYMTGLPRYHEANRHARDNMFTIYSAEADRRITELRNSCTGCLDSKRISTPIRIEYIPVGTGLTVVGKYLYEFNSVSNSGIRMLIVRDEHGNSAEISEARFESHVIGRHAGRESRKIRSVVKNIESFNEKQKLHLSFCKNDSVKKSPDPAKFMRDFQMEDEVVITTSNELCDGGYNLEFRTLESYLTANYYFREWGLYGKWSRNLSKSDLPKPPPQLPSPKLHQWCDIKLGDVLEEGNCPGPDCDLSMFCKPNTTDK